MSQLLKSQNQPSTKSSNRPLVDISPKMYRLILVSATVALISSPIGTSAQLPNGQCAAQNVTCRIEEDNLVGIASDVADLSECSDITNEGDYFTYYGSNGFPFVESCLYFSSCQTLDPCEDCTTQDVTCATPFCTAPIEGTLGANLVAVIDNVDSEEECDSSCVLEAGCALYTHHRNNDSTYPNTCFLLSALGEPVRECEDATCVTGLPNCEGSVCAFIVGGIMFPQGVLVIEREEDVEVLTLGVCPSPVAIAIGGGGGYSYLGGAGSGYINYSTSLPVKGYLKMQAYPGGASEDSYVRDLTDSTDIVRGEAGQGVDGYDGGAGYSGGGGGSSQGSGGGGGGGSDGSDGRGGATGKGGAGSGFQIDTIRLTSFVLSPGKGGSQSSSTNPGGGGGGVLIDGQGPDRPDSWIGEGFGGGDGHGSNDGLPGAVIFDFAPDE